MSFFEALSIASQERIHSQLLYWMLSDDCQVFTLTSKMEILSLLTGGKFSSKALLKVRSESRSIDILIEGDEDIVVIENKIKSLTHSKQLSRYVEDISARFPGKKKHFIYLALNDEQIDCPGWSKVFHSQLCELLLKLPKQIHTQALVLGEYLQFYKKLCTVHEDFMADPGNYPKVFSLGSLSKEKKEEEYEKGGLNQQERFILCHQLETIFQMLYFTVLGQEVQRKYGLPFKVQETQGTALLNLLIGTVYDGDKAISLGVQYQHGSLKLFLAPSNYDEEETGTVSDALVNRLREIKLLLGREPRFNPAKKKGFNSLSIKFCGPWEFLDNMSELEEIFNLAQTSFNLPSKRAA